MAYGALRAEREVGERAHVQGGFYVHLQLPHRALPGRPPPLVFPVPVRRGENQQMPSVLRNGGGRGDGRGGGGSETTVLMALTTPKSSTATAPYSAPSVTLGRITCRYGHTEEEPFTRCGPPLSLSRAPSMQHRRNRLHALTLSGTRRMGAEQMLKTQGVYGDVFSADKFRVWLTAMLTGKAPNGKTLRANSSRKYRMDIKRVGAQGWWSSLTSRRCRFPQPPERPPSEHRSYGTAARR